MLAGYEKRQFGAIKVWHRKFRSLVNVLHWHDEIEIIYIHSGTATVSIEGKTYEGKAGDLFLVAPKQLHSTVDGATSVITVILADHALTQPFNALKPVSLPIRGADYLVPFVQAIKEAETERRPFYESYVNALTAAFFARLYGEQKLAPLEQSEKHNTLISLFEKVEKEFATVTFEEICRETHYSPAHLSRTFKSLSGLTFTSYLNSIRIGNAVEMIKSGKNVTETAFECGYNSIRHFDRTFKSFTGFAPMNMPQDYSYMAIVRGFTGFDPTDKSSVVLE